MQDGMSECMECEHDNVEVCDGERICTTCGTIFERCIDEGAEWRVYANTEDDPSRTGTITSELLPNSSYGSIVSRRRGFQQSDEAKLIAKFSSWSSSCNGERSWMSIFDAIQSTAYRAGLPKAIIVDACALFKNVEDAQKTRGETRRALMAAALFTTCRQQNATRSHDEVAKMFHVTIRALCKALVHFETETSSVLNTQLGIAERVCSDMELSDTDRDQVMHMLSKLPEMEHTPKTIVAGVLSIVLGGQIPRISESSGVSVVSIRKIVEKLTPLGKM